MARKAEPTEEDLLFIESMFLQEDVKLKDIIAIAAANHCTLKLIIEPLPREKKKKAPKKKTKEK